MIYEKVVVGATKHTAGMVTTNGPVMPPTPETTPENLGERQCTLRDSTWSVYCSTAHPFAATRHWDHILGMNASYAQSRITYTSHAIKRRATAVPRSHTPRCHERYWWETLMGEPHKRRTSKTMPGYSQHRTMHIPAYTWYFRYASVRAQRFPLSPTDTLPSPRVRCTDPYPAPTFPQPISRLRVREYEAHLRRTGRQ